MEKRLKYLIIAAIFIIFISLLLPYARKNLVGKAYQLFSNNPVAYYNFDSCNGISAADSSGFGNHGAVYGANWIYGYLNQALDFDGISDAVIINESVSLSPQNKITVQAWIYPKTNLGLHGISGNWFEAIGSDKKGYLLIQDNERIGFYVGSGNNSVSVFSNNIPNLINNWHHVAGVYDASTGQAKLYID